MKKDVAIVKNIIDISTHHRESTYEFVEKKIDGKEWLKRCYDKDAKRVATYYVTKYGVNKTRNIVKSVMVKAGYNDFY